MLATIAFGVGTLGGAILVSRRMYARTVNALAPEVQERLGAILKRIRFVQLFPIALLSAYAAAKIFFPSYRLHVIFISWAAYNVYLLFRTRWMMGAFRRAKLPADFQMGYVFSGMIAYSGLVSSLLILYHGGHL